MKALFDQIPKLIDLTLEKIPAASSGERPETAKARAKLIKSMRRVTNEMATLSSLYGQEPVSETKKTARKPKPLGKLEDPKEERQLSFDFMDDPDC